MCRTRLIISGVVVLLSVAGSARGQTTRPVSAPLFINNATIRVEEGKSGEVPTVAIAQPSNTSAVTVRADASAVQAVPTAAELAWPRMVQGLARALCEGDRATIDGMLSNRGNVRRFGMTTSENTAAMCEKLSKSLLVGQHAYMHPPLVMAADIAADFKLATTVPDRAKARFLIDDDVEMKRANATAVQWVVEQFAATQGTPIGVIVLWTPRANPAGGNAPPLFDTVFVLCRGEEVGPLEYKLTNVVYGNPIPEGN